MGPPGSGKGTLAQEVDGVHLSIGDISREHIDPAYKEAAFRHQPIPFEKIERIFREKLEEALDQKRTVVIDGYPKTKEQCAYLDEVVSRFAVKATYIVLEVSDDVALERIMERNRLDYTRENTIERLRSYVERMQEVFAFYASDNRLQHLSTNEGLATTKRNFLRMV